ncbi:MAG: FHA domain-containing protein [Aquabacterium sp.]
MDSSSESRRAETPIALIERLDRDGHVLQGTLVYRWPLTIGRSFEADLVLDDPHLAPMHAELDVADGALHLKVGETINGAVVGARHVHAGQAVTLATAQTWRVGGTRLRVRLASEPLAPEQPLARHLIESTAPPLVPMWRNVLPILLISLLLMLFEQWLDNDPGTPLNAYLSIILLTLGATLAWALFWALGSKLFQGRLDFKAHLRLALRYGLTWTVLEAALPLLAYVTGWPTLSRVSDVVCAGVLCALVWAHLSLILPAHRIGLMAGVAALYLGGVGLHVWFNEQRTGQMFSERYATALPPPSWRLAGTQPVSALIDDAKGLKAKLDQQAKDSAADEVTDPMSEE